MAQPMPSGASPSARVAPGFFRSRRLGRDLWVATSLDGRWALLDDDEHVLLAAGRAAERPELFARATQAGLTRDAIDVPATALRLRRRNAFLAAGPSLHIFVVTMRCNTTCAYCHSARATMDATDADMTPDTADRALDVAFETTSPVLAIELQGGEPLVAFDVVRHVIDGAIARSARTGKDVTFTIVSNLSCMTDDVLAWLVDRRVQICTSVDGPASIHDGQRRLPGASAFERTAHWIARANEAYARAGLDPDLYRVEALVTTTRPMLSDPIGLLDTYEALGCRALFLRPLDPFGFAERAASRFGYGTDEFLAFYRAAVTEMIARARAGSRTVERFAGIFLTKILRGDDPGYLDIRSPCGAGIGQLAYDATGAIYTCDEGRMLAREGDETFRLGHVRDARYRALMAHPTVRAMLVASNLDAQPACTACAYRPYCGVCPVHNHKTQRSLAGRTRESSLCAAYMGIQDFLFETLARADGPTRAVLERWTSSPPRERFVHRAPP